MPQFAIYLSVFPMRLQLLEIRAWVLLVSVPLSALALSRAQKSLGELAVCSLLQKEQSKLVETHCTPGFDLLHFL